MGRKKKVVEEIKEQPEVQEVKVQDPSTFKYQGNVTVSFVRKGRVIKTIRNHNEGTNELFRFLLNCLAGNYYANDRPVFIRAVYDLNHTSEVKPSDYTPSYANASTIAVPITQASVQLDNDLNVYTLTYQCLVPRNTITNTEIIDGLRFYSTINYDIETTVDDRTEYQNYSMQLEFGYNNRLTLIDADILISWSVRISNVVETTS